MTDTRLIRSLGALVTLGGAALLLTGGIASAHGGHHHATHGRSYQAAKGAVTGCPVPSKRKSPGQAPRGFR